MRLLVMAWLFLAAPAGLAQDRPVSVSPAKNGAVIHFQSGAAVTVPKEKGQVGIDEGQIAWNGSVGWFVLFHSPAATYPFAGEIVIWRSGKVIRRFLAAQTFWSWAFYDDGKQVAFHDGPMHGEQKSYCELRSVASGQKIASWSGDLIEDQDRPIWTTGLNH